MSSRFFVKHRWLAILAGLIMAKVLIFHGYGPYYGKVVEAKSGKPVADAVVLFRYNTLTLGLGQGYHQYADAVEVLSDEKGIFYIPRRWVAPLRIFHLPAPVRVRIFRPGFGLFPIHEQSDHRFGPFGSLPEDQEVTVKLPRLKTMGERWQNLDDTLVEIPPEKRRLYNYILKEEVKALDKLAFDKLPGLVEVPPPPGLSKEQLEKLRRIPGGHWR